MNTYRIAAALALASLAASASAQMNMPAAAAASMPAAYSDAEVRKVDKDKRKVTLKHGEIANLGMPPMTMVFDVKEASLLGNVKAGDRVRFKAVNDAGKMTVVEIQPAR